MTKKKTTLPVDEKSSRQALLDKAEDYLDKCEYDQAETIANEVLASIEDWHTLSQDDGAPTTPDQSLALCILGELCWYTSRFEEGLAYCQRAFDAAKAESSTTRASDPKLQARALSITANIQRNRGDFRIAIATAEQAVTLAQKAEDKQREVTSLNTIGLVLYQQGNYTLALEYHSRALVFAEELGTKRQIAATLNNIGNVHCALIDSTLALNYYTRALTLAEEANHKKQIAMTLGNIGHINAFLANYPDALHYYARAITTATDINDKRILATFLLNSGDAYRRIVDYPSSLDFSTRALAIAEEIGDKMCVAAALGNIGIVYNELADIPRALEYMNRALAIHEEIGDKEGIGVAYGSIGLVYIESGNYTRGLEYLKRALELGLQIGARGHVGFSMMSIATAQHKQGNLEDAYQGFLDALRYRREVLKTDGGVADTLLELGRVSIERSKLEEGLSWLEQALTLAERLGEKLQASKAHREISGAVATKGDLARAYEHIMKYIAIEKEIQSDELKKRVDLFNMRVAIAEVQHGVEVQKLQITHMERDLANNAIQLAAQTDLLDHFRNDLREIVREIEEPLAALKKIKEKLKALPCQQIDWPKFEAQFMTVHPGFKQKLEEKFPALTPQEVRMCSLVRVGLRNPEIAKLLCLSERTLENHRFNIRKKLGLKTEQSLHDFLSKNI